jgi:hypothetical protein
MSSWFRWPLRVDAALTLVVQAAVPSVTLLAWAF